MLRKIVDDETGNPKEGQANGRSLPGSTLGEPEDEQRGNERHGSNDF